MADAPLPSRSWVRRIFRVRFPQVVIGITAFLYVATQIETGHHIDRQWFTVFRTLMLIVAALLLTLWALFFSGWHKLKVVLALALLMGGAVGLFRVERDGDMRATLHAREWALHLFGVAHEDDVAAHRKRQADLLQKRPIDLTPQATDFPGYRGSDRTGIVEGPALAHDWTQRPPRVVWKQPTYGGYSAFAIVNGFLFTLEQRGDNEAAVCYDADNGNELWVHSWRARFEEKMGGDGPRASPTVYDGDVFAFGAFGKLVCLNGKTGELKWSVDTLAGSQNLTWAMSGSPLVYGDLVVVNPGSQTADRAGRSVIAYDRRTGKEVWAAGNAKAGYSSPMLTRLGGRWQVLVFDATGLGSYDPQDGVELWRHPWRTGDGINVAQPLVLETTWIPPLALGLASGSITLTPIVAHKGQVFIASGYGRGGVLLEVGEEAKKWRVQELWTTNRNAMRCKFTSPIFREGYIYGLDDGDLQCISAEDGRIAWSDKRRPAEGKGYGHGQILGCGDLLVVLTEFGEVALVDAKPERFNELGRLKVLEGNKTWNNPAMADGRLYIRNHREMACVDLR